MGAVWSDKKELGNHTTQNSKPKSFFMFKVTIKGTIQRNG